MTLYLATASGKFDAKDKGSQVPWYADDFDEIVEHLSTMDDLGHDDRNNFSKWYYEQFKPAHVSENEVDKRWQHWDMHSPMVLQTELIVAKRAGRQAFDYNIQLCNPRLSVSPSPERAAKAGKGESASVTEESTTGGKGETAAKLESQAKEVPEKTQPRVPQIASKSQNWGDGWKSSASTDSWGKHNYNWKGAADEGAGAAGTTTAGASSDKGQVDLLGFSSCFLFA